MLNWELKFGDSIFPSRLCAVPPKPKVTIFPQTTKLFPNFFSAINII